MKQDRTGDDEMGVPPAPTIELVAIAVKSRAIRCRKLSTGEIVTLRPSGGVFGHGEAEILTVRPSKEWTYKRSAYISGDVVSSRLDVRALGLAPLRIQQVWIWDPEGEYWAEPGDPIPKWARPIIAAGKRPTFEMEQVIPGADPDDPFDDPITIAVDHAHAGDLDGAVDLLQKCLEGDLRCLDAHAHLGYYSFGDGRSEWAAAQAIKNYEAGVAIGSLSLGPGFNGVLPWGLVDNRPFLRCLHGLGLCQWRLGRLEEARATFERILWLNPGDHQGVRFILDDVAMGRSYLEFRLKFQLALAARAFWL